MGRGGKIVVSELGFYYSQLNLNSFSLLLSLPLLEEGSIIPGYRELKNTGKRGSSNYIGIPWSWAFPLPPINAGVP